MERRVNGAAFIKVRRERELSRCGRGPDSRKTYFGALA